MIGGEEFRSAKMKKYEEKLKKSGIVFKSIEYGTGPCGTTLPEGCYAVFELLDIFGQDIVKIYVYMDDDSGNIYVLNARMSFLKPIPLKAFKWIDKWRKELQKYSKKE